MLFNGIAVRFFFPKGTEL